MSNDNLKFHYNFKNTSVSFFSRVTIAQSMRKTPYAPTECCLRSRISSEDFTMTTSKEGKPDSPSLDDFTENVPRAKRDLVLRFVKDQEALQTSQVDLKIVDDETIDLIDSALVVKGEDGKITNPDDRNIDREQTSHGPLSKEISSLNLDADKANNPPEGIIVPQPPSGRPRTRSSSSRKRSLSSLIRRRRSVENSVEKHPSQVEGNECFNSRDLLAQTPEKTELNSPFNRDEDGSGDNLNASWPQEFLSRKFFIPLENHSLFASRGASYYYNAPVENFSGIDNHSEALRPRSSQSFQRVRPAEILSARISSASECERITCNASSLTHPPSYSGKLGKGSRRRTYINFNRLDAQLALEGSLELEQVHPSDIPLYRSSSAASSSAPYTLVHVPPIGREGPAPSSS